MLRLELRQSVPKFTCSDKIWKNRPEPEHQNGDAGSRCWSSLEQLSLHEWWGNWGLYNWALFYPRILVRTPSFGSQQQKMQTRLVSVRREFVFSQNKITKYLSIVLVSGTVDSGLNSTWLSFPDALTLPSAVLASFCSSSSKLWPASSSKFQSCRKGPQVSREVRRLILIGSPLGHVLTHPW